eukprot:366196-Chlamydomonas_euryale.AAC.20
MDVPLATCTPCDEEEQPYLRTPQPFEDAPLVTCTTCNGGKPTRQAQHDGHAGSAPACTGTAHAAPALWSASSGSAGSCSPGWCL